MAAPRPRHQANARCGRRWLLARTATLGLGLVSLTYSAHALPAHPADETHNYCVRASGGPLTVTLVWTDYPRRAAVRVRLRRH